jgi:hypothetical protein
MGWLSSLPTGHVTRVAKYYDQRTDPDDEDAVQVQLHEVVVTEYRGLTYATALAAMTAAQYSNGSLASEIAAGEAGSYTLITTLDYTIGDWYSTKYTAGG